MMLNSTTSVQLINDNSNGLGIITDRQESLKSYRPGCVCKTEDMGRHQMLFNLPEKFHNYHFSRDKCSQAYQKEILSTCISKTILSANATKAVQVH